MSYRHQLMTSQTWFKSHGAAVLNQAINGLAVVIITSLVLGTWWKQRLFSGNRKYLALCVLAPKLELFFFYNYS